MHHTKFLQSPVVNNCLKVKVDDPTEPQLIPKFLLQVSVSELYKTLLASQYMVDSNNQEMKMIISLSVILHYVHYCHPNVLCRRDYSERLVASFAHKIK